MNSTKDLPTHCLVKNKLFTLKQKPCACRCPSLRKAEIARLTAFVRLFAQFRLLGCDIPLVWLSIFALVAMFSLFSLTKLRPRNRSQSCADADEAFIRMPARRHEEGSEVLATRFPHLHQTNMLLTFFMFVCTWVFCFFLPGLDHCVLSWGLLGFKAWCVNTLALLPEPCWIRRFSDFFCLE